MLQYRAIAGPQISTDQHMRKLLTIFLGTSLPFSSALSLAARV